MKLFIWTMSLSLTANVVLAGLWLKDHTSGGGSTAAVASAPGLPGATGSAGPSATVTAQTTAARIRRATWKDIQNNDLKEYVHRLRACGCPEQTVRDIIYAEVSRQFGMKKRALWPERKQLKPFWSTEKPDPAQRKFNREKWRQNRELDREKSALLVELLGVDPEKEARREEGIEDPPDWQGHSLSFLPDAKRDAVAKYLDEFDDKMQDFYERSQGLWDSQTRAEQKQLEEERMQGLAQYLSPDELREYELHNSQLATQLSFELRGLTSLTREQYEAIYDVRKKYGDSIYNYGDDSGPDAAQRATENQKAMQAEIEKALGPDSAKLYNRSRDWSYQQLNRLASRSNLPADTASKIYDYKDIAEQSVRELQSNLNLNPEQRNEALQKIRDETDDMLKKTLGDKGYERYLSIGGGWIYNLSPGKARPFE